VFFSGSREPERLEQLAVDTFARSGSPREAVEFAEVVFFSVPWPVVDDLLAHTVAASSSRRPSAGKRPNAKKHP
jgi:predicted dinucleotide-binding enzyme